MNYKKFFALSLLTALIAAGCSDDKKDDNHNPNDACANYVSSCDGSTWKTCKDGAESTIVCKENESCDAQKGCIANSPADDKVKCDTYKTSCRGNIWYFCVNDIEQTKTCGQNETCDAEKGCIAQEEAVTCDPDNFAPSCDREANVWRLACERNSYVTVHCDEAQGCDDEKGCIAGKCDDSMVASCDGSIYTSCEDGTIKHTNCAQNFQVCTPAKGCVDYAESTCDASVSVATCEGNVLHFCDASSGIERIMNCPQGTYCDPNRRGCRHATTEGSACTIGESKCEGNMMWLCLDDGTGKGVWLGDMCSDRGLSCVVDGSNASCKAVYSATCDNNVITLCDGTTCITENCTANGLICDEAAQDCVSPKSVICNGTSILVQSSDKNFYAYDCASNNNPEIGCNTVLGCADMFCDENKLTFCGYNGSDIDCLTENCADSGTSCSDTFMSCISCNPDAYTATCDGTSATYCDKGEIVTRDCAASNIEDEWSCVEGKGCVAADPCDQEGAFVCIDGAPSKYKTCIDGAWYVTPCNINTVCDAGAQQCVFSAETLCGNGQIETGEKCDPGDDLHAPAKIHQTCDSLWPDTFKVGSYTGSPSCNSDCSAYDSSTCIQATATATEIYKWPITDTASLATLTKQGATSIKGGFTTTEAAAGAWKIGPWGNAGDAAFDDRYIRLNAASSDTGDLTVNRTLGLSFKVVRNDKGPKYLKIRFYNDNVAMDTSEAIAIGTETSEHLVNVKTPANYTGTLSIRISAYGSASSNGGFMTLSELAIKGTSDSSHP